AGAAPSAGAAAASAPASAAASAAGAALGLGLSSFLASLLPPQATAVARASADRASTTRFMVIPPGQIPLNALIHDGRVERPLLKHQHDRVRQASFCSG